MKKALSRPRHIEKNGSAAARLLLIDEDEVLVRSLVKRLSDAYYVVDTAGDGERGYKLALRNEYHIILLDLLLPGKRDGMQFLHDLQKAKSKSMVLIMSAKSLVEDKVDALRAGADDYVTKPFAFQELEARLEALLRRRGMLTTHTLNFLDLNIDLDTRKVLRDGKELKFSSKVFDMLTFLIRNKNRVVSRRELAENVWGYKFQPESNLIDVYVSYLRKELDKGFSSKMLQTVRNVGFLLSDK